jgi:hypothetical protein
MKFSKIVSTITLGAFLAMAPMAFATSEQNGCDGPNCSVSGNFDISTLAAGGNVDADLQFIPFGAAGGLSAGGGVAFGEAEGEFETGRIWGWVGPKWYNFGWKTVALGSAGADLTSIAGGGADTETGRYFDFDREGIEVGVYSFSNGHGITGGSLDVDAFGLAYSGGLIGGIAGQATLDASGLTTYPWIYDSKGITGGIAGQGSVGGFIGGGIVAGLGSAEVGAQVDMYGHSYSNSYRGITWSGTEYLGTQVAAYTTINTFGYKDTCLVGCAYLEGGYVVAGGATAATMQKTPSGMASANATGVYTGKGDLNCNFNGSAVGYTNTSATRTLNGSVMTSSAGMRVSANMPDNTPN